MNKSTNLTQLTKNDRCDACGAAAQVRVEMEAGPLLFCGHHGRRFASKLSDLKVMIYDPQQIMGLGEQSMVAK